MDDATKFCEFLDLSDFCSATTTANNREIVSKFTKHQKHQKLTIPGWEGVCNISIFNSLSLSCLYHQMCTNILQFFYVWSFSVPEWIICLDTQNRRSESTRESQFSSLKLTESRGSRTEKVFFCCCCSDVVCVILWMGNDDTFISFSQLPFVAFHDFFNDFDISRRLPKYISVQIRVEWNGEFRCFGSVQYVRERQRWRILACLSFPFYYTQYLPLMKWRQHRICVVTM